MKYFAIKKYDKFQHYKDRSPTWIKLHKSLIDDYEYQCLPLASRALAPMLWLLASEYSDPSKAWIEANYKKIAFRLRVSEQEIIDAMKPLLDNEFIEIIDDAIKPLAEVGQLASPETYREETYREETEESKKPSTNPNFDIFKESFEDFWEAYPKKQKRKAAFDEFCKAMQLRKCLPSIVIQKAKEYAESEDNPEFQSMPAKWLEDERWEDKYEKAKPKPKEEKLEENETWKSMQKLKNQA